MPNEWSIREYRDEDEQQALRLFAETFGSARTAEVHRWKFCNPPARGSRSSIYVAVDGNRIVGQFGGVAQAFVLGDEELIVMQGCDVLTDAEYRRRGVLASVGRGTFDGWADVGVDYCTGLENKAWGSRIELLDLRPCLVTRSMSLRLRPDRIATRRIGAPEWISSPLNPIFSSRIDRRNRGDKSIKVQAVDGVDGQFDELWQVLKHQLGAGVRRDDEWIGYRYQSAPHVDYRLLLAQNSLGPLGYICYRNVDKGKRKLGIVADLFADWGTEGVLDALIRAMLRDLDARGADTVKLPLVAHPEITTAFERFGFSSGEGYTVVVIPLARTEVDPMLSDPRQWYVMPGDFDIV